MDLIGYSSKGIENAIRLQKEIDVIVKKKTKKIHEVKARSQSTKFLDKMMNFLDPLKEEDLLYSQEEIQVIKQGILNCIASDEQLWNYNLKDNIVSSITKEIREEKYAAHVVPELLEKSVIPDLQQLGLADLIPELQETLVQEYKKDLPVPESYQISEKDMYLYVPDFSRKIETNKNSSMDEWGSYAEPKEGIERTQRSLKENGITLGDLSSIYKEVGALDRQSMATNIAEEQKKEEERNSEEVPTKEDGKQGDDNISL